MKCALSYCCIVTTDIKDRDMKEKRRNVSPKNKHKKKLLSLPHHSPSISGEAQTSSKIYSQFVSVQLIGNSLNLTLMNKTVSEKIGCFCVITTIALNVTRLNYLGFVIIQAIPTGPLHWVMQGLITVPCSFKSKKIF